jgi:hypothetical protein
VIGRNIGCANPVAGRSSAQTAVAHHRVTPHRCIRVERDRTLSDRTSSGARVR